MTQPHNVRLRTGPGDYGEKPLRRYELTASLAAGGSAAAKFVQWDRTLSTPAYDDTAQTLTLYSGAAKVTGNPPDRGWCYYAADSQRWEAIAGGGASGQAGIGVLQSTLYYGTTVGAVCQLYAGPPGHEEPTSLITLYEWKLEPGDSLPPQTMVDVNVVNGYSYLRNASCGSFYYLPPPPPCFCGPCSDCAPSCVTVAVSGMGGDYTPLNGTWVLPLTSGGVGSPCTWTLNGFATACGELINLTVTLSTDGTVTLTFTGASDGHSNTYTGLFSGSDCSTFSLSWSGFANSYSPPISYPQGGGICLDGGNSGEDSGASITLSAGGC